MTQREAAVAAGHSVSVEEAASVPALFLARVAQAPDAEAWRFPEGERGWGSLTWRRGAERVRDLAGGVRALGLSPGERCAILSSTRIEWVLSDLGILSAGGATTTIYPSNTPEECAFILQDSEARVVFAEDASQVAKLASIRDEIPRVEKVVVFDGEADQGGWVVPLAEFEAEGHRWQDANPGAHEARVAELGPEDLATLIYTSGTTGRPKGVRLVHDCWVFEAESIGNSGLLGPEDHQYLWLPLSHSFGKVMLTCQLRVGFVTTVDGRVDRLMDNLPHVRPTMMAAAPRIFEKAYNRIISGITEQGGGRYKLFQWALSVGQRVSRIQQQGRTPGTVLAAQHAMADRLVLSKIRERFGGRLRYFISGSAPLARELAEFFHAAGILILEGYGLTESSAASCVNRLDRNRFGTVGPPLPGVEVKIAEDGEVLLKGRGIMRGYHGLPEATAEVLTPEGWLLTGDVGRIDDEGFLRITDRKKDLIKTSGGKYVAPQKLEGKFKALCPYCSNILVHGNHRNFVSALITLDPDAIAGWARERGLDGLSPDALADHPEVRAMVQEAVDRLNSELASYETIKRFAVLPSDFSLERGEVTPSQKVKRKVVEDHYGAVLDGFYEGTIAGR